MKKKILHIFFVFLLIISIIYGQEPPTITLSSGRTIFTVDDNKASVPILTTNVKLQADITGTWAGNQNSMDNKIIFGVFTLNLAGTYTFTAAGGGNQTLTKHIDISVSGINFAEVISQGVYYVLSGNNIFNVTTTLACATSGTSQPHWRYKAVQTDTYSNQSSTTWDSTTGISTLTITTTQQGYHTCIPLAGGTTYTVAIFNPDVTVEVTSGSTSAYTKNIDSPQLQLLCRSSSNNILLDNVQWKRVIPSPAMTLSNPVIIDTLRDGQNILRCDRGSDVPFGYVVFSQGPPTMTIVADTSEDHTLLPPMINTADITVFSLNVMLQVNLDTLNSLGRWNTPLTSEITDPSTTISEFTANLAGLYTFFVKTFEGTEEIAIQIQISVTGSNFAELTSSNEYTLLSGNNIFYTDTTLVCVTSDTNRGPVWSYRDTQQGRLLRPTGVVWDTSTGISRLDIVTTQQGYYTCSISGESYRAAIFNSDITTTATDGSTYTYTRRLYPSGTQLLCKTDSNTALSDIRWGFMDNPLILDSLQNQDTTLICRKVSTGTMELQVDVVIQGPPVITLSTTSTTNTYSDLPTDTNTADIIILSQNVMLQVNLDGRWELPDGSSLHGKLIEFELFTKNLTGMYKFIITGLEGEEVIAIQIEISAIDVHFAERTSQREYSILSGNEIFYTDTTLACIASDSTEPQWKYKQVLDNSYNSLTSAIWNSTTGISTLTITTTQQGYYTCTAIVGGTTYTVGIFNPDVTVELTTGNMQAFTRGIDSPQLQLLCRSSDASIALDNIQWTSLLNPSPSIQNPFIVNTLSNGDNKLRCYRGDTAIDHNIIIQGPPTITITDTSSRSYTMLPSMINTADITVFSQNVMLKVNLGTQNSLGGWNTPLSPEITTSSTTISEFTVNLAGLYKFYVMNLLGNQELAIQIQISAVGSNFAKFTSNEYTLLSGNNIFYTDTTLVCVTSDTSVVPVWSYKDTQKAIDSTPHGINFDISTRISAIHIVTTKQGYYTCTISGESYRAALFTSDITTIATDGKKYTYTRGLYSSKTQLLCTADSNTALSDIRWDSLDNPLILDSLQNQDTTMACIIVSTGTMKLQVDVVIQGPPVITLSTTSTTNTYSDLPTDTNTADIMILSQNVMLQVNLDGRWELPDGSSPPGKLIEIELFTKNLAGMYKFYVPGLEETEKLAIQIEITAIDVDFAERTSQGEYNILSGNEIFYTDTTLVCIASDTTEPQWKYKQVLDNSYNTLTSATWDSTTGISYLSRTITQQGYYMCTLAGGITYTIAILDPVFTVEPTSDQSITYTKKIDPSRLQILCTSTDPNVALDVITWSTSVDAGLTVQNPVVVNSLSIATHTLRCNRATFDYTILVQGPPILTITGRPSYTSLPPEINTADITVLSQNIILGVNLAVGNNVGRWVIPHDNEIVTTSIDISNFTPNLNGIYKFVVTNFSGMQELAIQITITAIGSNFAALTSPNEYTLLSENNIVYTNTTLVCVSSDTGVKPEWRYRETQNGSDITLTGVSWDPPTGISTLDIVTTRLGYYTCNVMEDTYRVAIFSPGITNAIDGKDYTFTKGIDSSDIQLLCTTTNSNIELSNLRWGTLKNPLVLISTQNQDKSTKCIQSIENGSTKTILTVNLIIQGPPVITLITSQGTYSSSLTSQETNSADIMVFSQNIVLQTNLKGKWQIPGGSLVTNKNIILELFTRDLVGAYKFYVINWFEEEIIAIQMRISAAGTAIGTEKDSTITPISSNTIFYKESITLVAASAKLTLVSGDVVWSYQESFEGSKITIDETNNILSRSISKLDLDNMADGYYSVSIRDSNSNDEQYIVGIFNGEGIYDTIEYDFIKYTPGVDSEELQILCIPLDNDPELENIKWTNGSRKFPNPVTIERVVIEFNIIGDISLACVDTTTNEMYNTTYIMVLELPTILLTYDGTTYETRKTLGGELYFDRSVSVYTQDVKLKCNKNPCRWTDNDGNLIGEDIIYSISYLTINTSGEYFLKTLDNNDNYQESVQINLTAIGTAFLTVKSNRKYEKLENNSIINMTETILLACATSYKDKSEDRISWYFQEDITSSPVFDRRESGGANGLSILEPNKPGYYYCYVKDHNGDLIQNSVGLIALSKDIIEITQEEFTTVEARNFTIGEPLQYYHQNIAIPITAIRWGIEPGNEEDRYREFLNPVNITEVFNRFGSGAFNLSCFYRESPITFVGILSLNMKDTANLTIEYERVDNTIYNITKSFGDLNNPNLRTPQNFDIPVVTKKVKFSCDLPPCEVENTQSTSPMELVIDSIRIENQGIYSLRRTTATGTSYTTASIFLKVTGFIEQNIIKLNQSVINDTTINISWDLEKNLPDNAEQTFNITYQTVGGEIMQAGVTQGDSLNITDLTAGVTYNVSVELSYTYTYARPTMSIQVTIQLPTDTTLLLVIVIVVVLILILLFAVIAVVLITLCIWKLRRKNGKKFTPLNSDGNEPKAKPAVRSSHGVGYEQIAAPPTKNEKDDFELTELTKFNPDRNSRNYQNLQEVKDPRMKPIPLDLYKRTIDKLWEDENALENEYRSLGGEILRYECRFAQTDQNRLKNKYKFIYPYDTSRVVLKKIGKDVHSDYINASHIPGMYVDETFIAAQGPKVNTIQDVWRMVFEWKIRNIVMVTNCVEGGKQKCEEYFPSKEGKTSEYAQYRVKTVSMTQYVGHITRILKIESPTESIQVKHFHFIAWPDHDVPSLHDELLLFIGYVQENIMQSDAPILVHCSAGVGRTGTFITLFNLRAAILKRQPISIYYLVHEMREHRPHMVQTFRQYKFIYLAVLELLLENTSIPAEEFSITYQTYLQSDQSGYVSVFFQQFSELNYQCEKSFEYSTENGEENEEKNPIPNILPYDNNRVVIYSPHFECGYINASYHENNLFITTQHPTGNTLLDFVQMIYQTEATLVVMLTTAKEKAKIQGNMSDRKPYWPNKDVPLEVPPFQIEVVNSEKSTSMIKQKVILRNLQENSERAFTQVMSTSWTERSDPTDLPSVLVLLQMILKHRQESPNSTIIMHCSDSISKTGVMFSVYQCIKEMERTGKVDIFHTVKRLRRERMKLIPTLMQYLACFSLMNEYCSST